MAGEISESQAINWIEGEWIHGNPKIMGPLTHGAWMSSVVFDGARAFEGVTPDLGLHCRRTVQSAEALGLTSPKSGSEIEEIAREGIDKFWADNGRETAIYIRPMIYAQSGFVAADPDSAQLVVSLIASPMPDPKGFSACLSDARRPAVDMAPTNAKASCLYPNAGRAIRAAAKKGFDNGVMLDANGNVAEFCTSNLFIAKDGAAHTPAANGTFLAGITRSRVIALLRNSGVDVHERPLRFEDVLDADEVFSTGNYGKVMPVTRIENRNLQPGPVYSRARDLYWEFAHAE